MNTDWRECGDGPLIEVFGRSPSEVQDGLLEGLAEAPAELLEDESIRRLREATKKGAVPAYDQDWAPFGYLYFGANLVKTCLAARHIQWARFRSPVTILDLGAGSGASTVGTLLALASSKDAPDLSSVVVVDRSRPQLELLERAAKPWIKKHWPEASVEIIHRDLFEVLGGQRWRDCIVVLSYVTPELTRQQNSLLRSLLRRQLSPTDGEVIIVTSDHNPERGVTVERLDGDQFVAPYDYVELDVSFLGRLGLKERPKFGTRDGDVVLLRKYMDAWQYHDISAIREIFADDADYEILGSKTLEGIEEIAAYWDHNRRTQRSVRCTLGTSERHGDSLVATWSAGFERVDLGEEFRLSGIMWLRVGNGRIQRLTEAFRRESHPISISSGP